MVSITLFLCAAFAASDAGRVGESGTGAMWIAPELVATAPAAQLCSQPASLRKRDLVFEKLAAEDIDVDLPRQLTSASREIVVFEWNADTGELHYDTSASSTVFSDLAPASPASSPSDQSCGSR